MSMSKKIKKKAILNDIFGYLGEYMKRLNKDGKAFMLAKKLEELDCTKQEMRDQMHVDLGVALHDSKVNMNDIISGTGCEITAGVPNENGTYNIVSALMNESEVYFWMPNIPREEVEDAAEFVRLHVQKYCAEKYGKMYFAA